MIPWILNIIHLYKLYNFFVSIGCRDHLQDSNHLHTPDKSLDPWMNIEHIWGHSSIFYICYLLEQNLSYIPDIHLQYRLNICWICIWDCRHRRQGYSFCCNLSIIVGCWWSIFYNFEFGRWSIFLSWRVQASMGRDKSNKIHQHYKLGMVQYRHHNIHRRLEGKVIGRGNIKSIHYHQNRFSIPILHTRHRRFHLH